MLPGMSKIVAEKSAKIAARLGIATSKVTADGLANMVRKNKVTAAFVAYELFGAGSEIVQELAAQDEQLAKIVETLGYEPDKVSDTENVIDITKFGEEFATIRDAAEAVGGLANLVSIRKALTLDEKTYQLFLQFREMSRQLG
jgi:precorrin-2 methylase